MVKVSERWRRTIAATMATPPPHPSDIADQIAAAILAREETLRARRAEGERPPPTKDNPPPESLPASKAVDIRRLSLVERDKFVAETLIPFFQKLDARSWRKADAAAENFYGPIPKKMLARAREEAKFRGKMGRPRKSDK
jgi:hypothetical protein